jgi:hypothetical protein
MRWGIQDANEAEATTWNQGNYLVMRGIVPIEPEDEAKEKTKKPHGMLPSALPFSTGRLKKENAPTERRSTSRPPLPATGLASGSAVAS